MKWMKERDALIAQTLAFVQSVARKKDDAKEAIREGVRDEAGKPDPAQDIEPALIEVFKVLEPAKIAQPSKGGETQAIKVLPGNASSDIRTEMQNRVASFRAHQQRFHREREEYFSITLAKARAVIADDCAPLH